MKRFIIEPTCLDDELEGEDEEEILKNGNYIFASGEQI